MPLKVSLVLSKIKTKNFQKSMQIERKKGKMSTGFIHEIGNLNTGKLRGQQKTKQALTSKR